MKALLWKEYRNNRSVVLGGTAMVATVYAVVLLFHVIMARVDPGFPQQSWRGDFVIGSVLALAFVIVLHAWIAADIVAKERVDRSAEFILYLPVTRLQVIGSKAALAIGLSVFLWLINLAVLFLTKNFVATDSAASEFPGAVPVIAATAVLVFGATWFGSCALSNPMSALGLGVMTSMGWTALSSTIVYYWKLGIGAERLFQHGAIILGVVGFVSGTVHYLRRKDP